MAECGIWGVTNFGDTSHFGKETEIVSKFGNLKYHITSYNLLSCFPCFPMKRAIQAAVPRKVERKQYFLKDFTLQFSTSRSTKISISGPSGHRIRREERPGPLDDYKWSNSGVPWSRLRDCLKPQISSGNPRTRWIFPLKVKVSRFSHDAVPHSLTPPHSPSLP